MAFFVSLINFLNLVSLSLLIDKLPFSYISFNDSLFNTSLY
ncbi:hypothetical protein A0H76_3006 [Hepatospora eriocheir]|uniref:Uncharacterized protein n=1 Tax=Hepatospora eriocheir TaxID=1081669 RepID=A0A1X0QL48_9MICR|nr:hypothetical protein A0H76_3006 [Hepatospora eriocheir]